MKNITITAVAIAMLAVPASLAADSALMRATALTERTTSVRTCDLEQTDFGFKVAAKGTVRFSETFSSESLGVKVEAKVEDKTLMIVSVDLADGRSFDIGAFNTFMGVGTLSLAGDDKTFDNDEVLTVAVRVGNDALLVGKCGATK